MSATETLINHVIPTTSSVKIIQEGIFWEVRIWQGETMYPTFPFFSKEEAELLYNRVQYKLLEHNLKKVNEMLDKSESQDELIDFLTIKTSLLSQQNDYLNKIIELTELNQSTILNELDRVQNTLKNEK